MKDLKQVLESTLGIKLESDQVEVLENAIDSIVDDAVDEQRKSIREEVEKEMEDATADIVEEARRAIREEYEENKETIELSEEDKEELKEYISKAIHKNIKLLENIKSIRIDARRNKKLMENLNATMLEYYGQTGLHSMNKQLYRDLIEGKRKLEESKKNDRTIQAQQIKALKEENRALKKGKAKLQESVVLAGKQLVISDVLVGASSAKVAKISSLMEKREVKNLAEFRTLVEGVSDLYDRKVAQTKSNSTKAQQRYGTSVVDPAKLNEKTGGKQTSTPTQTKNATLMNLING